MRRCHRFVVVAGVHSRRQRTSWRVAVAHAGVAPAVRLRMRTQNVMGGVSGLFYRHSHGEGSKLLTFGRKSNLGDQHRSTVPARTPGGKHPTSLNLCTMGAGATGTARPLPAGADGPCGACALRTRPPRGRGRGCRRRHRGCRRHHCRRHRRRCHPRCWHHRMHARGRRCGCGRRRVPPLPATSLPRAGQLREAAWQRGASAAALPDPPGWGAACKRQSVSSESVRALGTPLVTSESGGPTSRCS